MQGDRDVLGVPADALVGGVVEDLVGEVVDAAAVGGADVHARPLADRIESFEVREVISPVEDLWLRSHEVLLPAVAAVNDAASLPGTSDDFRQADRDRPPITHD
ncbi:hypothetical protein GCM10020358_07750 [Amorphoplanes nipponensis]|uniref:Uncharacterized protein n=1 Tax=Actinoplanes nipponensis TaxID=135950 RepID=A0A919JJU1_9ACTN|nr:hypothetical protein Ani05nite_16030 [Actinoplanes nipponensis]